MRRRLLLGAIRPNGTGPEAGGGRRREEETGGEGRTGGEEEEDDVRDRHQELMEKVLFA